MQMKPQRMDLTSALLLKGFSPKFNAAFFIGLCLAFSQGFSTTAVDTGEKSFSWNDPASWQGGVVPDGVGVDVRIDKFSGLDRNVNLGAEGNSDAVTIGILRSTNDSDGRNRIRRGSVVFQMADGNAEIHLDGIGNGRLEFRMDENVIPRQEVRLESHLHTFVNQLSEDGHLRFRGSLTGPGGLTLNGPGEVRLRQSDLGAIFNAEYEGPTVINEGVLRLRTADLTNTSLIEVFDGGQLRLDARAGGDGDGDPMNIFYLLGSGPITLRGYGRDENNPELGGATGAIRQQGQGTPADIATIANPIILAADSVIHTNSEVSEGGSVLNLIGSVSGDGFLIKSGGGHLSLSGANTFGGLDVSNGSVSILSANALPNAPLIFSSRGSHRSLSLEASATVSMLDGSAPDPDLGEENNLFLDLAPGVVLTVNQEFLFDDDSEEFDTRFQGEIRGEGGFTKDGDGRLRFTRFAKSYSGPTLIRKGALEVSTTAALPNTSEIIVEDGGQLRLSTSASPAVYNFGGPIRLSSIQRDDSNVPEGEAMGVLGGLRYDPGTGQHTAWLESDVIVDGSSKIHVDGQARTLELRGDFSGNADVGKAGGGLVVFNGTSDNYTGTLLIENGPVELDGRNFGGSIINEAELHLNPNSHIFGDLALKEDSTLRIQKHSNNGEISLGGSLSIESGVELELLLENTFTDFVVLMRVASVSGLDNLSWQSIVGPTIYNIEHDGQFLIGFTTEDGNLDDWDKGLIEDLIGLVTVRMQGPGFYRSDWLGDLVVPNITSGEFWLHSSVLGWVYLRGRAEDDGVWIFPVDKEQWYWSHGGVWPFMVRQDNIVHYIYARGDNREVLYFSFEGSGGWSIWE